MAVRKDTITRQFFQSLVSNLQAGALPPAPSAPSIPSPPPVGPSL